MHEYALTEIEKLGYFRDILRISRISMGRFWDTKMSCVGFFLLNTFSNNFGVF